MKDPAESSISRRSPKQWLVRGISAAAAATIGWFSVSDTLANVVVKSDPGTAHALAPWDGIIAADLAQVEMSTNPTSNVRSQPARLARKAIRLDPTAVEGLGVLGLQAQLRGQTDLARGIFTQSLALSRRELRPQVWAIEEAVSRGDIESALSQYDVALRTSRRAPEILFPVLASAIAEPKIRIALIAKMQTEPVWGKKFIGYVSRGLIAPVAAVPFFQEGEKVGLPIDDPDRTSLVNALARQGESEVAWDYYRTFRKTENNHSRDPNFTSEIKSPSVFDWVALNSPGISSSIRSGKKGGVVDFSAAPSVGGVVIQQRQVLQPGIYAFESLIGDVEQPLRSRPYWILTCQSGRELGRIEIPNAREGKVRVTGRFDVPAECPTQTLALVVRPSDEISGVFGRVYEARLGVEKDASQPENSND